MRGKFLILVLVAFILSVYTANAQDPVKEESSETSKEAVTTDETMQETEAVQEAKQEEGTTDEMTDEEAVKEEEEQEEMTVEPAEKEKPVSQEVKKESKDKMPLAEYLDEKSDVGSVTPLTLREIPVIKTIITREQIKRLGVRDLLDVLRLVAGFEPALDTFGATGAGFRGNWVGEGRYKVMLDGHSLVERAYSTVPLGNRISVDQIQRIEIIRSPGGVLYGREAELAVINIVTRTNSGFEGIAGSYHSGYFGKDVARQNFHVSAGHSFDDDIYLGASVFRGYANRTNLWYTDIFGSTIKLADQNKLNPNNFLFNLKYHGFELKFMYEDYVTTSRDGFDALLPNRMTNTFASYNLDARYHIVFSDQITLTPSFVFSRQNPWGRRVDQDTASFFYSNVSTDRYTLGLEALYEPVDKIALLIGTQYDYDRAEFGDLGTQRFQNGSLNKTYYNYAIYAEGTAQTWIANPTGGIRYEYHSYAGDVIAARIGITKLVSDFHLKFMYNRSFRTPSFMEIDGADAINFNLKSEKSTVIEAEVGYNLLDWLFYTVNFFDMSIKNPIIYQFDSVNNQDTYINTTRVGTRGVETEARFMTRIGYAAFSYSYYMQTDDELNQYYTDLLNPDRNIGFPNHKIAAYGTLTLFKNFSISPSIIVMTDKTAYVSADPVTGAPISGNINTDTLFNLYFLYENAFIEGMGIGFGMYDLFNQKPSFIQAYNGYHTPLSGPSREFIFNLTYEWGGKDKAKKDPNI